MKTKIIIQGYCYYTQVLFGYLVKRKFKINYTDDKELSIRIIKLWKYVIILWVQLIFMLVQDIMIGHYFKIIFMLIDILALD